jgi:hypothetical protein
MTHHLVNILRKEPSPHLDRLLCLIRCVHTFSPWVSWTSGLCVILSSHDLHATYLDIHAKARGYRKEAREANKKLLLKGKEMREVAAVEMNNFQDPQISSLWPLDMKGEVWDP